MIEPWKHKLPALSSEVTILNDAIKSCEDIEVDFDTIFSNTITSYNPDSKGRSSGKSGSDIERILAFHKLGLRDPIEYADSWNNVLKNAGYLEVSEQTFDQLLCIYSALFI